MRLRFLAALSLGLSLPAAAQTPTVAPLSDADFPQFSQAEIDLGQALFWDKELSGNRNIACATCHHPRFGSADGLSLGIGEGGNGIGTDRKPDPDNYPEQRIPRNAPALWNAGALGFTVMFADGRIEKDPSRPSGFRTPMEDEMVSGFASLLSAQTMFPVLSNDEMAGHNGESDISKLVRQGRITGPDGAWEAIAKRISAIPAYQDAFDAVYPEIKAGRPIGFTDISNAIAAYMTFDFRSDTSPFDAYLRGEADLSPEAEAGRQLFYGKADCSTCHSGALLSDMKFHAMGDLQIGPGKAERFQQHQQDTGRMRVSNNPADAFAFRTPSLRNVTLTAPYGHAGAYQDLTAYLRQHIAPQSELASYDISNALLPKMEVSKPDLAPEAANFSGIAKAAKPKMPVLNEAEIREIVAFLQSLEDPIARAGGKMGIPPTVPSGLGVDQ